MGKTKDSTGIGNGPSLEKSRATRKDYEAIPIPHRRCCLFVRTVEITPVDESAYGRLFDLD